MYYLEIRARKKKRIFLFYFERVSSLEVMVGLNLKE